MARPWGSRTPFLRVMWTRAFMPGAGLLHGLGPGHVARTAFGKNTEPARHFLVSLGHLAEVAPEAVLVQFLVGLHVPQAAVVGADLVGKDDAHILAFPKPAEFELEVHQLQ